MKVASRFKGESDEVYLVRRHTSFVSQKDYRKRLSVFLEGKPNAVSGYRCECITAKSVAAIVGPLAPRIARDGMKARQKKGGLGQIGWAVGGAIGGAALIFILATFFPGFLGV